MPTGNPSMFQCSCCRKKKGAVYGSMSWNIWHSHGLVSRVKLTGKSRPRRSGPALGSMSQRERQYRCEDCGHVGWSRHCALESKEPAT